MIHGLYFNLRCGLADTTGRVRCHRVVAEAGWLPPLGKEVQMRVRQLPPP
jgi:hypothetical protein